MITLRVVACRVADLYNKTQMERPSNLRDFEVQCKLGEGAFGQVFKVKRLADGKEYALKKVKIGAMKEKERDNALNEIRILASYNDDYIIGYKEAFYDEVSGSLCVVMEFAEGGDILKRIQGHLKARTKYKEEEIWRALVHMTLGLKSLHERKILHRDLKCANIFIAAGSVYKLGDLNVSKVLKKDMAQTQTGTPYYASPEVWKDKPYGPKSDMWSLGCVCYEMAALRPPFMATDLQGLYKKVCAGMFERIPAIYSNDLAAVISSLLKVDPDKRPNADQILSNSLVRKHYDGKLEQSEENEEDFDELLKTIKYNPRDLKALKNILPKANYEQDIQRDKLKIEDMKGGIQSAKNARKQPNIKQEIQDSLQNNEKRLMEFLERKKMLEEKQRQNHLKLLMEQKDQLAKKRERVLSACGLRPPPNLYQSPKIAVHSKNEVNSSPKVEAPSSSKNVRKQQHKSVAIKLPPKPQPNINYKLPPKPTSYQVEAAQQRKPSINNIHNVNNVKQVKEIERVSSARGKRSSSVQKIIYPSWWG